ncbi:hypothetical protein [Actinocatenispora thailandica]|uniref:aa3-type cytochrome oxidase subunit CtaJ n=1 Tax=Actinocatenispora thailandica TaxID=227318 RepID=UPI00194E859B|nr:hypothetical protein [Actinocatenispora thailandica]
MTVWEVVLVFVGIPVGVFLLLAAAVYGAGSRRSRRYRPGRPFEFAPVWFLASPERILTADDAPEPAAAGTAMLPAGGSVAGAASGSSVAGAASGGSGAVATTGGAGRGVKGGASGSW